MHGLPSGRSCRGNATIFSKAPGLYGRIVLRINLPGEKIYRRVAQLVQSVGLTNRRSWVRSPPRLQNTALIRPSEDLRCTFDPGLGDNLGW